MDKKEYQKLGINSGVTAIIDAIYDTDMYSIEDEVLEACIADPQKAVKLIRYLVMHTPGRFAEKWTSCAAGTPIENW